MKKVQFEWDEKKNRQNQAKHDVSFELAQYAFADPNRVIAEDCVHIAKMKSDITASAKSVKEF